MIEKGRKRSADEIKKDIYLHTEINGVVAQLVRAQDS
tara:strand:- start:1021 stop:1131 length:111 start_codon:yes stop_codon:yes gene_type:complete